MLQATGLQKMYGEVTAVHDISLEISPGSIVGLVGNNGAGKTTTIKMLCGILHPTEGKVRLQGHDPTEAWVRKNIGFLPEDSPLYDDQTPLQYLRFFGAIYGMKRSQLKARIESLLSSLRLDVPYWKRPIGQLSKGSQRKVAIARALLHDPQVVILDEPTSGLDPNTRRELEGLLVELRKQGKAILLSAHDLNQVERLCDSIVLVHLGRVPARGTLAQLREKWGGWTYVVQADTKFPKCQPDGAIFQGKFRDIASAEAAMKSVRESGGTVLRMESVAPALDEIMQKAVA